MEAAVSPTPTERRPETKISDLEVSGSGKSQSGREQPQSRYMGVRATRTSFSSAYVANASSKNEPRGGMFATRIVWKKTPS